MPRAERNEPGTPHLHKLLQFTLALVSELQPKDLLRRIVETACMLVDARSGALVVSFPNGRTDLIEFEADVDDPGPDSGPGLGSGGGQRVTPMLATEIASRRGFRGTLCLTERQDGQSFSLEDEQLVGAFAEVAAAVIDGAHLSREARQQELWVALHGEIATALLAGVSFAKVLDLVIRGARELLEADVATLCLPATASSLVVSASDGRGAERLLGASVPLEGSVSGEVLRTGEPVILTSARSDSRKCEPILVSGEVETAMVVPLSLKGRTSGVLAVGRAAGNRPLTKTDFWMLESFAAQVTIALEYRRARRELERLALLDDQERIARDLHDTVIQQLFATGMSLQATAQRITDPAIVDRVQQAVQMLDSTIRDIRATVFALRSTAQGHEGLRHSFMALAEQVQEPHAFTTHMTFDGPVDTTIDAEKQAHLLAALREALSNVARHACAFHVEVSLRVDADVVLRVVDDGVGIDEPPARMSGLRNLRARAEELGGSMTLGAGEAGGTVLEWSVPLERPESPED